MLNINKYVCTRAYCRALCRKCNAEEKQKRLNLIICKECKYAIRASYIKNTNSNMSIINLIPNQTTKCCYINFNKTAVLSTEMISSPSMDRELTSFISIAMYAGESSFTILVISLSLTWESSLPIERAIESVENNFLTVWLP